jgi:hypothetical protein
MYLNSRFKEVRMLNYDFVYIQSGIFVVLQFLNILKHLKLNL